MLNYSTEVFYSPNFIEIYSKTDAIMLGINTISFMFIFYVIIFYGQILENYRWLLLNFFALSYLVDVVLVLLQIIPFCPANIFYFDGIIGRHLNVKLGLSIFFSTIAIKLLGFLVIILYRYAASFPGKLKEFVAVPKNLLMICVGHYIVGCSPFMLLILDTEDVYEYVNTEVPALREIKFGPNVSYIPRCLKLYIVIGVLAIFVFTGISVGFYYSYLMYHQIRKIKSEVSENTHRLQQMLFISVLMEHFINVALIAFPTFLVSLVSIFPVPYGSYFWYIMFITMSLQTTISSISHIYFIKPFRKAANDLFFVKIVKKLFRKKISIIHVSAVNTRNQ